MAIGSSPPLWGPPSLPTPQSLLFASESCPYLDLGWSRNPHLSWNWEALHHFPHGLSWSLLGPLSKTLLLCPILTRACWEDLSHWGNREGAGEPSVAVRQALPDHISFSSWGFPRGVSTCPFVEHPGGPGPGPLLCPLGMCPLHIFLAITHGLWHAPDLAHLPGSQDVHLELSSPGLSPISGVGSAEVDD